MKFLSTLTLVIVEAVLLGFSVSVSVSVRSAAILFFFARKGTKNEKNTDEA